MTQAPSRIYIHSRGKEQPEWVVERMTTGDAASDGSFEIEASDGIVTVQPGFAIFEIADQVFACPPKLVQSKIADALPPERAATKRSAPPRAGSAGLRIKPAIGKPPVIEWIAPAELKIDDTYQRSTDNSGSQNLIRKIASTWNWELCVPLIVSRRGDGMYVIDGQHRMLGAQMRGDIAHLPCSVHNFAGREAEAELFVQANRARKPMQRLDDFHAAIASGDEDAMAVDAVVRSAGLVIGRNQAWQHLKPREVVFIASITKALRKHGEELVGQALTIIAEAFIGQPLTTAMPIFDSLCTILADAAKSGAPLDRELMVVVLGENRMEAWKAALSHVGGVDERYQAMLKAIRSAYAEAGAE